MPYLSQNLYSGGYLRISTFKRKSTKAFIPSVEIKLLNNVVARLNKLLNIKKKRRKMEKRSLFTSLMTQN